jgi:hypothetical protein
MQLFSFDVLGNICPTLDTAYNSDINQFSTIKMC